MHGGTIASCASPTTLDLGGGGGGLLLVFFTASELNLCPMHALDFTEKMSIYVASVRSPNQGHKEGVPGLC